MLKKVLSVLASKRHQRYMITREILIANRLKKSSFFLLAIFGYTAVYVIGLYLHFVYHLSESIYADILYVYFALLVFIGIIELPYHPEHYGFNLKYLKWNLITGITIGAAGALAAILIRIKILVYYNPSFQFYTQNIGFDIMHFLFLYPLIVIVQEIVCKGFFQTYFFSMFSQHKMKKHIAVIISSFIFALSHLILGGQFFFITLLFSIILGYVYEKSRSLVGVVLLHYLTGVGMFFLSSFPKF